ncbi:SUMF1/EgtB/PvdO family nonheme iron enzyme [Eisenbergiella sp.]
MANFDLSSLALQSVCPNNVIKVDDTDLPSVLVYIPAFKNSDVLTGGNDSTHPAFIVNGVQIPGFYYSKYQNVVHTTKLTDGDVAAAYSLPGEDPAHDINFDTSRARCEAKGAGWHMSTNAEWAAIALWCKKNGFMPYGNNNYGKDTRESNYKAIPLHRYTENNVTRTGRVATGTGPLTWSHDKTLSGIWDLNGNVWEWQSGIRFVWGELQILANNDAADPDNPQNTTSTCWKAINAADGSLVDPECRVSDSAAKLSGNTIKLDYVSGVWTYTTTVTSSADQSRSCPFWKVTCTAAIGAAAKVLLRSLAILPDEGTTEASYEGDYYWLNNGVAERCVLRGGSWNDGAGAGVFAFDGNDSRAIVGWDVGFRSAYIPEIG